VPNPFPPGGATAVGAGLPTEDRAPGGPRARTVAVVAAAVFALAFAVRLYPVLQGAGLHGLANYDDGVHYAAAVGLVHGELPYRDFLLLHPPGIVVLLAPAAALGRLVGDPDGFALARLGWMVMGGLNALLVGAVLRRLGWAAALVAAVGYAVFFPAVYSEHTVLLEAPATTGLLLSLLLLRIFDAELPSGGRWRYLLAGACLGVTATLKIWGVVPVLVVAAWLLLRRRRPAAWTYLTGAAGACVVVCLPFFLAAPATMWRMVVTDQLGRARLERSWASKLEQLTGISPWTDSGFGWLLPGALVLFGVVTLWCLAHQRTRLLGVLVVTLTAVLLSAPAWFLHYPALTAAPAMLVLGAAVGALVETLRRRVGPTAGRALVGAVVVVAVASAYPVLGMALGDRFPGASLATALASTPGCVAADDPSVLIETDLLRRNLDRGCPLVIDPGGYSYDLAQPGEPVSRARNQVWQAWYLDHLRRAEAAVTVRYTTRFGLSRATAETIRSWPVLTEVGDVVVRRPQPAR
jgi:alpha-1,2-mannosyltransferase